MARTAIFAVALNGTSIGSVALTGAAESALYHVNADTEPGSNDDSFLRLNWPAGVPTVEPDTAFAGILWRSLSQYARELVAAADPELAAKLDRAADAAARAATGARIDARAAADAARNARADASRRPGRDLPDSE